MAKTLIVYATRTGDTQKIGEIVAEGLRFSGQEVRVINVKDIKTEEDLNGYDAICRVKSADRSGRSAGAVKHRNEFMIP